MENVNKEFPSVENAQMTGHKDSQGRPLDSNMAQKKLRRLMASREYSQKYRMKQLHYILQLETEVKALQAEVSIISPRIKYVDRQNSLLRVENGSIKHRLSTFSSDLMIKEAEIEENKAEVNRLRQLHLAQQQQNMQGQQMLPTWNEHGFEQIINESFVQSTEMHCYPEQIDENIEEIDEWSKKQELAQTWISTLSTSLLVNPNGNLNMSSNLGGIEQMLSLNQNTNSCVL
ncbi:hypothetical protein RCOM_1401660 [Ricinus communis]|uniref:BZIP domain-containing protein n=1 Tax=Ricinus communis TaxID=3988 RepID=B9RRH0_RICCO|nr:hypothetical protein RCOM_1401660 [Ricinus communis]